MKYSTIFLLAGLLLAGCGGDSNDTVGTFGNQSNVSPQVADVSVGAVSGRLRIDDNQIHLQLDGASAKTSTPQDLLQQLNASSSRPREARLTYQVGSEQRTIDFQITRILAARDGSLVLSGNLANAGSVTGSPPQVANVTNFSAATLRVGQPLVLAVTGNGSIFVAARQGWRFRLQSLDSDQNFDRTYDVSINPITVPVDYTGSDYKVTLSANGFQDLSFVTTIDLGEATTFRIDTLAPNGVATGTMTVHVEFDDFFNTDANNNDVTFLKNGVSGFSGVTNSDGKISFTGVQTGITFDATAYSDSSTDTASGRVQAGQTLHLTVPGHL